MAYCLLGVILQLSISGSFGLVIWEKRRKYILAVAGAAENDKGFPSSPHLCGFPYALKWTGSSALSLTSCCGPKQATTTP